MTSLTEVAADVAAALGLRKHIGSDGIVYYEDDHAVLETDGGEFGISDPCWRCRCEDWLIAQRYSFAQHSFPTGIHDVWQPFEGIDEHAECPWPEAPARLVSAVWRRMKEKT